MSISWQSDLLSKRREAILGLANRLGIVNVRVFGSVARGDESTASDIDLLVDIGPEQDAFDYFQFWGEVEELLGIKVDVVLEDRSNPKQARALAEAVPL